MLSSSQNRVIVSWVFLILQGWKHSFPSCIKPIPWGLLTSSLPWEPLTLFLHPRREAPYLSISPSSSKGLLFFLPSFPELGKHSPGSCWDGVGTWDKGDTWITELRSQSTQHPYTRLSSGETLVLLHCTSCGTMGNENVFRTLLYVL